MKTNFPCYLSLGLLLAVIPPASESQWVQTTGLYGGQANSLAVSGSDLFVSNYGSGLYRSTDNGARWNRVHTGFQDSLINCIVTSGSCLFASVSGTGGVFRSTDSCATWSWVFLPRVTIVESSFLLQK